MQANESTDTVIEITKYAPQRQDPLLQGRSYPESSAPNRNLPLVSSAQVCVAG